MEKALQLKGAALTLRKKRQWTIVWSRAYILECVWVTHPHNYNVYLANVQIVGKMRTSTYVRNFASVHPTQKRQAWRLIWSIVSKTYIH